MALRAKAQDGDGLALEGIQRGISFINHFQWLRHVKGSIFSAKNAREDGSQRASGMQYNGPCQNPKGRVRFSG
jgi:hypothetical protein